MWYLISLQNPDVKYTLLIGHKYLVGRKDCDILLAGDAAVSRKHAEIELVHPESNITHTDKLPTVTLTDVSKFGTTVNEDKIQTTELHDGDMIVFGNSSNFTLVYEPFIISSSCLDLPSKKKMRQAICTLGGHIVNDWRKECTLLVMNNISVTIKVVCALLSMVNIVTPDYLEQFIKYLKSGKEKPNPDLFLPVITETQVDSNDVSFKQVPERKKIFQGMKFIFLDDKQFKKMHLAVELGGGLPVMLEKFQNDKMVVEKGSVVMYNEQNKYAQDVKSFLKKHNKHMIQDAEVGFAVLFCSTDKHCNPDTEASSQMVGHVSSQSVSNTDILVANTEVSPNRSPTRIKKKKCEIVLDETKFANKSQAEQNFERSVKKETRNTSQTVTLSKDMSQARKTTKRGRVEEEEELRVVTPLKKKVKQEIFTPTRTENESRNRRVSPRRSPSPATRSSPRNKRDVSPSVQMLSQRRSPSPKSRTSPRQQSSKEKVKVKEEIIEDSDDEKDSKKKHHNVIIEDSDDEFPDFRSTRRGKKSINSDDEFYKINSKNKNQNQSNASQNTKLAEKNSDDELPFVRSSQRKTVKKEASPTPRSKRKHTHDSDDEIQINNGQGASGKNNKHRILVEDSDEEIEQRGNKKKKIIDNSDDEFDRLIGKKKKTKTSEEDNTISSQSSKNKSGNSPSRQLTGQFTVTESNGSNGRKIKTEEESTEATGFVSSQNPNQTGDSRSTDYVKEEGLPSKCINIKFVDLVARKPNKPKNVSTEGVPDGYIRWKGKIVRNYKNFRKTEHAGANALPRIIGGSDLVAHNAANRKDLDDWFNDALQVGRIGLISPGQLLDKFGSTGYDFCGCTLQTEIAVGKDDNMTYQAESQQNETERKAKELFDWQPGMKKRSR